MDALPKYMRRCTDCGCARRITAFDGGKQTCRRCLRERREHSYPRLDGSGRPRPCPVCAGLSWRVRGPRCRCCGLLYQDEPEQQLQVRGESSLARLRDGSI